jgi:hypothetical protein
VCTCTVSKDEVTDQNLPSTSWAIPIDVTYTNPNPDPVTAGFSVTVQDDCANGNYLAQPFKMVGNSLKTSAPGTKLDPLNFESVKCKQTILGLTVVHAGLVRTCTLTLTLNNKNDRPFWAGQEIGTPAKVDYATNVVGGVYQSLPEYYIDEKSEYNAFVENAVGFASDRDNAQEVLYSFHDTADDPNGMFRISRCSGQIAVDKDMANGGKILDFILKNKYTLIIKVTDDDIFNPSDVQTNYAKVVINIRDVNDAPYYNTSSDPTCTILGISTSNCFELNENSAAGTQTSPASPSFIDPDGDTLKYSIDNTFGDHEVMSINTDTGVISLATGQSVNYEVTKRLSIRIIVSDVRPLGQPTLTASQVFVVKIKDMNDPPSFEPTLVSINENSGDASKVNVPLVGTDDDGNVNSLVFSIDPSNTAAVKSQWKISTDNYIALADGQTLDFEAQSEWKIKVKVTDTGVISTGIVAPKSTIREVTVKVNDIDENPRIDAISVDVSFAHGSGMPTKGGAVFTLTGSQFGPPGSTDGNLLYTASNCPTSVKDCVRSSRLFVANCTCQSRLSMTCTSPEGVGGANGMWLQVKFGDNLISTVFYAPEIRYAQPNIVTVEAGDGSVDISKLDTAGAQKIKLRGSDFGPFADVLVVTYGPTFATAFATANCLIEKSHEEIICDTTAGIGSNQKWKIVVQKRASNMTVSKTSYRGPIWKQTSSGGNVDVANAVSGPGSFEGNTMGKEIVFLHGRYFGPSRDARPNSLPVLPNPTVTYGINGVGYIADKCETISDVLIQCETVEGIGSGLSWIVQVGSNQGSPLFGVQSTSPVLPTFSDGTTNYQGTSYAPPIVQLYQGGTASVKTVKLQTLGKEYVIIEGLNFGTIARSQAGSIEAVSYGRYEFEFNATSCEVITDHIKIRCITASGAGKFHKWYLSIAGQRSRSPSTSYDRPTIVSFSAEGAVDSNEMLANGGDVIHINGSNFGPMSPSYLDSVTYGFSGTEYMCSNATVTEGSKTISCMASPGVGRNLKWIVTVGQQSSSSSFSLGSFPSTSYALPQISAISSSVGKTGGSERITITGTNFGFLDRLSSTLVKMEGVEITGTIQKSGATTDEIAFDIPECGLYPRECGQNKQITVEIIPPSGPIIQSSNAKTFSYEDPLVERLITMPPQVQGSDGIVLVIQGRNFCSTTLCAIVELKDLSDGATWSTVSNDDLISHSHTEISLVTNLNGGYVRVSVLSNIGQGNQAKRTSPEKGFFYLSPIIISDTIADLSGKRGPVNGFNTRGYIPGTPRNESTDTIITIKGMYFGDGYNLNVTVGGRYADIVPGSFQNYGGDNRTGQVQVYLPAGQGLDNVVQVCRDKETCSCGAVSATCQNLPLLHYKPPSLFSIREADNIVNQFSPLPTSGKIALSSTVGVELLVVGKNLGLLGEIEFNQKSVNASRILSWGHEQIRFLLPEGDGLGNVLSIKVGGQSICFNEVGCEGSALPLPVGFFPPNATSLSPSGGGTAGDELAILKGSNFGITRPTIRIGEYDVEDIVSYSHHEIRFRTPPGSGGDLQVRVQINGQSDLFSSFSYLPPAISTMSPTTSPTSGRSYSSDLPIVMIITGSNFAGALAQDFAVLFDGQVAANLSNANVSHTKIAFSIPPGQGERVSVTVQAGGQTSSTKVFSYDAPRIDKIWAGYCRVGVKQIYSNDVCNVDSDCPTVDGIASSCIVEKPTSGCSSDGYESDKLYRESVNQGRVTPRKCIQRRYLTLQGVNFGIFDPTVTISSASVSVSEPCSSCKHLHSRLDIPAPVGIGVNRTMVFSLPGHCADIAGNANYNYRCGSNADCYAASLSGECLRRKSNVFEYTYDAPVISMSVPGTDDAYDANGDTLVFKGSDFGTINSSAAVTINGMPCTDATWKLVGKDGFPEVSCRSPRDIVGVKDVLLKVAEQSTFVNGSKSRVLTSICKQTGPDDKGQFEVYYGIPGELCSPCPTGARCVANTHDDPKSLSGYWLSWLNLTVDEDFTRAKGEEGKAGRCAEERWNRDKYGPAIVRDVCPDPVPCSPTSSCAGNNTCATEYTWQYDYCRAYIEPSFCKADWKTLSHRNGAPWPNDDSSCGVAQVCNSDLDCDPDPTQDCTLAHPEHCSKCVFPDSSADSTNRTGTCQCTFPTRCGLCTVGTHYRINNKCEKCPDNPALLIFGFFCAAVAACVGGWYLNKKKFNLAFISIGVDYFQVLAIFSGTDIAWPREILEFFRFLRMFNLNIDIAAPECMIPNLEYEFKWYLTMLIPPAAFVLFSFKHIATICGKKFIQGRRSGLNRGIDSIVANFLIMFYYMYLSLTRRTLDIFNCNPTTPSDGFTYTEFTSLECSGRGGLCRCGEGIQARLVPPAVLFFFLYCMGFPVFILYTVQLNKKLKYLIKEDQMLRAGDTGDDEATNPNALWVRHRYHKIYYHFKPGKTYWILLIVMRKFMIAFAGLMFRGNPGFQLAVILLVLFTCYVAQVKHRPYMSSSERDQVLEAHAIKAQDGHAWHKKMSHRISVALRKQQQKAKYATKNKKKGFSMQKATQYIFDYNTVEMILLACSVLVCLAGIMFESDRFAGREDLGWQRSIITAGVFMVISFSMIYYSTVFIAEVYGKTPECLLRFFGQQQKGKLEVDDDNGGVELGNMFANPMLVDVAKKDEKLADMQRKLDEYKTQLSQRDAAQTDLIQTLMHEKQTLKRQELERGGGNYRKSKKKRNAKKKQFGQIAIGTSAAMPEMTKHPVQL